MTVIALATGFLAFNGRDNSATGGIPIPSGVPGAQGRTTRAAVADSMSGTPRSPTAAGVATTTASDPCRAARGAVRYYRAKYVGWRSRAGAGASGFDSRPAVSRSSPCPRYLAKFYRSKARAARQAYKEWREYHWHWQAWLPSKWQRIGACETGYGQRPGRWDWNSGTYQGAFGFYHGSWDAFVPYADRKAGPYPSEAYNATPRQQYEVALAIYRRFGLSGWGCRNA